MTSPPHCSNGRSRPHCGPKRPRRGWTAHSLVRIPSVRFIATIAGTHNLLVTVWLRSVDDVHHLEIDLAARYPDLTVQDRTIALHTAKRMGRVFDTRGHSTTTVPVGPWAIPR
ncbi:hypothetical protein AB0950_39550 [Streptomyces sp. NPDC007189]|uniref:hypothetical protein n=1 Tax=Streptomyces sp. NPDC007189 TaxID=3154315 RepID=UPI0034520FB2